MKKSIIITILSLVVFACSHKTKSTTSATTKIEKTSSATISEAVYQEGKAIYTASCGKCHKLYPAERGNMTQWDKWIDRMAPKAKLSADQKEKVRGYISVNAKEN